MAATGTATGGFQNSVSYVLSMTAATTEASETFSVTVSRAFRVTRVTAVATAAQAGATVTVSKAGSAFTGALAVAALNTVAASEATNTANSIFASGDELRFVVATAGAQCDVIVEGVALPVASSATLSAT
jgi:hypothetical protein